MCHVSILEFSPKGHGDFYLVFNSCTRASLLCMALSGCSEQGLLLAVARGGHSLAAVPGLSL